AWVYGGLIEEANHLYALIGLAVIAMGLWAYGRWVQPHHTPKQKTIGWTMLIVLGAGGFMLGYPGPAPLNWEPWSQDRVEALQQEGTPVYIDFTARWCVTCQSNKVAYKSSKVKDAFEKKGIVTMKADWTKKGPRIQKALEAYGEAAIPVNVIYYPNSDEYKILPKVLTPDVVLDYVKDIPDKK
ncbi:MAG: thioredoxin family protein, partial [Akkermansiaceae bacterium]